MKNVSVKVCALLVCASSSNQPLCWSGKKKKEVSTTIHTTNSAKKRLLHYINQADLDGVRFFTQTADAVCIDADVCAFAKKKFQDAQNQDPRQLTQCPEFIIMVLVEACAPDHVKRNLGLSNQ